MCLYARTRLPSVGVLVVLWTIGGTPVDIIHVGMMVSTEIYRPFKEIVSLTLEDLSSIETNR